MKKLLAKIRKILHDRRTRRFLTRFVSGIAAIVVFITTYALVLPAITMEKEANCGVEAHQHDDSCYTEELICDIPESEGHHHDEGCYSTKLNLICETAEHEHSEENGCYDEEGNLICELKEHRHGDECYEEVRELTCEIPESDGHRHTEECYEKVLSCGKEIHVHSTACYEEEPVSDTAVAASTSSASAATTSAGSVSSTGMTLLFEDKTEPTDDNETSVGNADTTDNDVVIDNNDVTDNGGTSVRAGSTETASSGETNAETDSAAEVTYGSENAGTGSTETANTALTNADNSSTASTSAKPADQYIPPLDAIDFSTVLNNHTGIYYYHLADGETVEDSYAIPAEDWKRIPNNIEHTEDMDDVELGSKDLLRVYLSYTIPAGSLNTTNPVARYRLPSNLHLTDPQVKAINENVNGIANQYIDMTTLEIKDPDKYNASLGLEAVEGTRKPDESVEDYLADQAKKTGTDADDASEYISAIVRVENVYDTEGLYGEKDAYLGQDLIFTFTPYSIEANQHEYDSTGQPTKAGKQIEGWLTLDLNMGQVDFEEPEITTSRVEKSGTNYVGDDSISSEIYDENAEGRKSDNDYSIDEPANIGYSDDKTSAGNIDMDIEVHTEDDENDDGQDHSVNMERVERDAKIVFVEEGLDEKNNRIDQISTTLTVVEETAVVTQDDEVEETNVETDETTEGNVAERLDSIEIRTSEEDKAETTEPAEDEKTEADTKEIDHVIMPAMSFTDSIKVSTCKPVGVGENAGETFERAAESLPEEAEVSVCVEADEGTFPIGTTMVLKAVEDLDAVAEIVADTVENSDSSISTDTKESQSEQENENGSTGQKNSRKTYGFQAIDITFVDVDGNEIEPIKPVRVALTSKTVEQVKEEAKDSAVVDPVVIHVDDDGNAEQMELVDTSEIDPAQGRFEEELLEKTHETKDVAGNAKQVNTDENSIGLTDTVDSEVNREGVDDSSEGSMQFQTDAFSIYAIVYTVELYTNIITDSGETYRVSVTYDETSGISKNAELRVREITEEDSEYKKYYTEAVKTTSGSLDVRKDSNTTDAVDGDIPKNGIMDYAGVEKETKVDEEDETDESLGESDADKTTYARFFDIEIWADGQKVEPAKAVSVSIKLLDAPEKDKNIFKIVHFGENGPEIIPYTEGLNDSETMGDVETSSNKIDKDEKTNTFTEYDFTASRFSVYSVVSYTVDFHWEVDGKLYEISLPGGGFVSFTKLMEVMGIAHKNFQDDGKEDSEGIQRTESKESGISFTFEDVQVSKETKRFVEDVESVEFSSPSLVWVGKIDDETTVGQLKENNSLEVQYSAELTEKQIEQINTQIIDAGDWALISLKAFDSIESLIVTLKNGEMFVIRVTDATPSRVYGLNTSGLNGLFTVNMFNYGPSSTLDKEANHVNDNSAWNNDDSNVQGGINAYTALDFMAYGTSGSGANHFTGGTSIRQGIVKPTLNSSGYPTLTSNSGGSDLDRLFNTTSDGTTKQVYQNVQGLFYKSNVDGSSNTNGSYYSYDSDRYYAYKNSSNQIEFYNQYNFGNNDKDVNDNGMNGKPVGFFPFTWPDNSKLCPHPSDVSWSQQHQGNYWGSGYYDHQFGLTLVGDFMIPEGKKVDNQDMIFKFSGDDDLWVFIDDVLVLDIGGIHHPSSGQINFTTGKVTVDNAVVGVRNNNTDTINMKNGTKVVADIATIISTATNGAKVWDNSEYSSHSIKVFYLERGGIYSNCKITFNIPLTLGKGSAAIVKKDADQSNTTNGGKLQGAIFGLWTNPDCTGDPIMTRESKADGYVKFDNLTVGADSNNLQVYYMKEIKPPYGYLKDNSIYTLTPGTKQNGVYPYIITDKDGNTLETMGQAPYYPIINNTKAKPIGLTLLKKWQTVDDTVNYLSPDRIPDGATAEFRVMRYLNYDIVELGSDGLYRILYSERKLDGSFNSSSNAAYTVRLPKSGTQDPWHHVFSQLPLTENGSVTYNGRQYTVQYYYEYFIKETDKPDNYETIYIDDQGKVVSSDNIGNLATIEADSNQTIINRELMNIPAQKHWDDFAGNDYDWTATLQLDYRNIPVPSTGVNINNIPFDEYNPRDPEYCKQISKSNPTTEFANLPMYITESDGKEYRREYSIKEIAYTVTRLSDQEIVFQYDYDLGVTIPQGDTYTPWFDHDAGEDDDYNDDNYPGVEDYNVVVHNLRENRNIQKQIQIGIEKKWSDQQYYKDSNAKAKFQLKRYILTEYRNYEGTEFANRPKVEIHLNDGLKEIESLRIPQGVRMSIHGYLKPEVSGNIIFESGGAEISYPVENETSNQVPFDLEFVADSSKTITLISGEEYVVGGASGFRFKEMEGSSQKEELDNSFCIEFELNKDNKWKKRLPENNTNSQHHESTDILPAVEVSILDADENTANTYIYRYFFDEIECTPDSFNATFTDSTGSELLGDTSHQIYFDTTIRATNRPIGLDILKVDLEYPDQRLPGAQFQLRKLEGNPPVQAIGGTYSGIEVPPISSTTNAEGKQTFKPEGGLVPGYYELTEIKAPDGYVLTEDQTFYIKVEELGDIQLLKRDNSGNVLWDEAAEEGELVGNASVSASTTAVDGKTITFTVRNEAGVELPSAGGSGTRLYYLLGGMLMLFGIIMLCMKQKA